MSNLKGLLNTNTSNHLTNQELLDKALNKAKEFLKQNLSEYHELRESTEMMINNKNSEFNQFVNIVYNTLDNMIKSKMEANRLSGNNKIIGLPKPERYIRVLIQILKNSDEFKKEINRVAEESGYTKVQIIMKNFTGMSFQSQFRVIISNFIGILLINCKRIRKDLINNVLYTTQQLGESKYII